MSDFLSAVSTVSLRTKDEEVRNQQPVISAVSTKTTRVAPRNETPTPSRISSPEDVLNALKSQPDEQCFQRIARYLLNERSEHFNFRIPSPKTSSILRHFISVTIDDFWRTSKGNKDLIVQCIQSIPGISGLVAEIKTSGDRLAATKQDQKTFKEPQNGSIHVDILASVLSEDDLFWSLWSQTLRIGNETQRRLQWREFVTLVTSGRIITTVARWEDMTTKSSVATQSRSWLSHGADYTLQMARQTLRMLLHLADDQSHLTAAADLFSRFNSLGYMHLFIKELVSTALKAGKSGVHALNQVLRKLRPLEQRRFLLHLLTNLVNIFHQNEPQSSVRGISALLVEISDGCDGIVKELTSLFLDVKAYCGCSTIVRRAAIVVFKNDIDMLQSVFEESMKTFGDVLFIQHAPAVQQDACAEVLLLSAGHLHRSSAETFKFFARSGTYSSAVSNRLNTSSDKSRVLGMCVGMAISSLLDQGDKKLVFDIKDVKTESSKALMGLICTKDEPGMYEDIAQAMGKKSVVPTTGQELSLEPAGSRVTADKAKKVKKSPAQTQIVGPRIVEVVSDEEDLDRGSNDLVPYPKPDSDPEDSDDDPTLINRSKPKTPLYVRDLIAGLHDQENNDRHRLALENAASLIRRKAQFGKEVKDHAIELGLLLIGLQDYFDHDNFIELRLQALIGLVISDPATLAPWFAQQAFDGDYSLSQRGTILSAIGLAARELAGYTDTDALNPGVTGPQAFPSKRLPPKYHAIYATTQNGADDHSLPPTPLNSIADSLTSTILSPIAAKAADAATGPSILKTRTFSSRLDPAATRSRRIPNTLSTLLHTSFFTPLLGHFHTHTSNPSTARARNIYLDSHFLVTYLKTLAILVHASGPGTVGLPALTSEFWDLLLRLRARAKEDQSVMEAVLFGFLALLEVNEDTRRLAEENGREVVETREWTGMVFERINAASRGGRRGGGQSEDEEERLRGLAAGVLVKCGEVMERWERLMIGETMMMNY